ncbi:MAG: flagellar motor protein MotB [Spongiibacteraceae bacterium]
MNQSMQPIIIKKKKVAAHAAHGGAWKVAFADFVTAMMAFFLLMWLLATPTPSQQKAIAGYFNDPGGSLVGPGGANAGMIQMDHPLSQQDAPTAPPVMPNEPGGDNLMNKGDDSGADSPVNLIQPEISASEVEKKYEQQEQKSLESLKQELQQELEKIDSVFGELKDQILIDYTALGLRIQIVDKEQRPMFDLGSSRLKSYSADVLKALAPLLDGVPNHISVTGHTDATAYGAGALYSNWELSADRANSARRALIEGKYPDAKVVTIQGMGSSAPFTPEDPSAPINRRIAIIVLKKSVMEALIGRQGVDGNQVLEKGSLSTPAEMNEPAPAGETGSPQPQL